MQPRQSSLTRAFLILLLLAVPFVAISAQKSFVPARITAAIDNSNRLVLRGNTHPLARAAYDRGNMPDNLPMQRMLLVLKRSPEQEAALDTLLASQQDASSPNFHKWLTPEEFGSQFGPADADIEAISRWLTSQGFQVSSVSKGRTVIEFSGDAGVVRNAFHTEIHRFDVNGNENWANASDPQIPAALGPVVAGVSSFNNFPLKPLHHIAGLFSRSNTTGRVLPVTPLFSFPGCGPTCYAVGPTDFATIYNVSPLWNAGIDGTGQTIAIANDSNINIQDVRNFRALFGLPANDPKVILNGSDPGPTGDEIEADLDVEWSGAIAKKATIDLVVSANGTTAGPFLSSQYIVDNNLAPVMSVSFGLCELFLGSAQNQQIYQLWQQAAAQGITVMVASGDQGSAGCDTVPPDVPSSVDPEDAAFAVNGLAVSGVASTPFNVAVGGTDFNDFGTESLYWNSTSNSTTQASAKSYIPESTWNDSCSNTLLDSVGFKGTPEANCNNVTAQNQGYLVIGGGGGGRSACVSLTASSTCGGGYPKPSWQLGAGLNDGARDLPDVSLFSGNGLLGSFYIVCGPLQATPQTSTTCDLNAPYTDFIGLGGTSASSPAFAAIMAMVNQKAGARQGNVNPILYSMAVQPGASCASGASPSSSCIFYDVASGTIAMPCLKASANCSISSSGDTYGLLPGYAAATGYDMATGLGSVNAANLVNNWKGAPAISNGGEFTLSSNPSAMSISAGQAGSSTISVFAENGFSGPITLACVVTPAAVNDSPSCSLTPNAVTVSASTPTANGTLQIATTPPVNFSLGHPLPQAPFRGWPMAASLLAGIIVFVSRRRNRYLRWAFAGIALSLAAAGCGGGSSQGVSRAISLGTPMGSYTVTIIAKTADTSQSANVALTVQ